MSWPSGGGGRRQWPTAKVEKPPVARGRLQPPPRSQPGHRARRPARRALVVLEGGVPRTGSIRAVRWRQSRQRRRIASAVTRMRGWVRGVILVVELRRSKSRKDNVRLSATLDEGEYAKLARLGAELDLSAAWMIRRAVSEFVARHGQGIATDLPLQRPDGSVPDLFTMTSPRADGQRHSPRRSGRRYRYRAHSGSGAWRCRWLRATRLRPA